ncbi:hypothetical protein BC832DRAFT_549529 [Gaertneriomyces semiglobifer]|nr:hypothetical protein BC832DRAFT_549529 [Gaertneriomyces semiglobifer]
MTTPGDPSSIRSQVPPLSVEKKAQFEATLAQLAEDTGEGAVYLLQLLRANRVPSSVYMQYKGRLTKSFSAVKWANVKTLYGYANPKQVPILEPVSWYMASDVALKIWERIMEEEASTSSLDMADREAKVVLWVHSVLSPILWLFRGAINNDAEGPLPATTSSTDGFGEFIYNVLESSLVVVVECKTTSPSIDSIAQLMVEMESAWCANEANGLDTPIVTGALCTSRQWYFMTYDGHRHAMSKAFDVVARDGKEQTRSIIEIIGIFWKMCLDGYIMALKAFIGRSKAQMRESGRRQVSYEKWKPALTLARQAEKNARKAKTDATCHTAINSLLESIKQLPAEHDRGLTDFVALGREFYSSKEAEAGAEEAEEEEVEEAGAAEEEVDPEEEEFFRKLKAESPMLTPLEKRRKIGESGDGEPSSKRTK